MDLQLNGKRALVTGSSSGIGEAIAKLLAAEGANVVIHGRDALRANAVADAIRRGDRRAEVVLGDLSTDAGAKAVAETALAGGDIDILVNNAGGYHHVTWHEATTRHWLDTYQQNVMSGVRLIHGIVPQMCKRGWGRVITIGGGLAIQPIAVQPDYNASLAARHNLAVSLARQLRETGVTSNVVAPGAIHVKAVEDFITHASEGKGWGDTWEELERAAVREFVPNDIGRLGRPEEVASAVAYLASPLAGYISGAILRVDGGTIRSL